MKGNGWRVPLGWAVAAMLLAGCGEARKRVERAAPAPQELPPLKLIVFDDPELAERIAQQWKARAQGELEVVQRHYDLTESAKLDADLVVLPSAMLGELAEWSLIEPMPGSAAAADEAEMRDILPLQRLRETMWGKRAYGVPFGSPQFVIYARRGVGEEVRSSAPATWKAYGEQIDRLARRLRSETNTDDAASARRYAVAEPLGPGWAARVLLARAAPYVRHPAQFSDLFEYGTMKPLIDQPPFVRALKELAAVARHAPPDVVEADPVRVKQWFYEGRVWIALSWPSGTFEVPKTGIESLKPDQVAILPLPGAEASYHFEWESWSPHDSNEASRVPLLGAAGRVGAVVRGTAHRTAAADALRWLTSRKWSTEISTASRVTGPFRSSHARDARWVDDGLSQRHAEEYGKLVEDAQSLPRAMPVLRIPGSRDYLQVLDDAVRQVVRGDANAAEALGRVAAEWDRITDRLGRKLQQRAYRRSLGLR